ncbi:hypothetical protein [Streptomyces sp. NPDC055134]
MRPAAPPEEINTVPRVNIDAGTGVTQVADTIRLVHERTGIVHFMIDPLYAAEAGDGALDHARDVHDLRMTSPHSFHVAAPTAAATML